MPIEAIYQYNSLVDDPGVDPDDTITLGDVEYTVVRHDRLACLVFLGIA